MYASLRSMPGSSYVTPFALNDWRTQPAAYLSPNTRPMRYRFRICDTSPTVPSRSTVDARLLVHAITQVWKLTDYRMLTHDRGTSKLSQGPSSGTNMVEIERWKEPLPPVRAFEPPEVAGIS